MRSGFRTIPQTWWHVEDQTRPSFGRKIRQVMDIYTNYGFLNVPLVNTNFVGLKVIGRNINKELAFIEDETSITVTLGKLKEWPSTKEYPSNIKHVKLEIMYERMDPPFEPRNQQDKYKEFFKILRNNQKEAMKIFKTNYKKIFTIFKTGYKAAFTIPGEMQPEFYITVPLGLEIEVSSIKMWVLGKNKGKEFLKELKPRVHINHNEHKERYNILIKASDYKKIQSSCEITCYGIEYETINNFRFKLIPLFALILISLSFIELISINISNIPYIAIVSLLALLLTLHKEGYAIPYERAIFSAAIVALVFLMLKLPIYGAFGVDNNSTILSYVNITSFANYFNNLNITTTISPDDLNKILNLLK